MAWRVTGSWRTHSAGEDRPRRLGGHSAIAVTDRSGGQHRRGADGHHAWPGYVAVPPVTGVGQHRQPFQQPRAVAHGKRERMVRVGDGNGDGEDRSAGLNQNRSAHPTAAAASPPVTSPSRAPASCQAATHRHQCQGWRPAARAASGSRRPNRPPAPPPPCLSRPSGQPTVARTRTVGKRIRRRSSPAATAPGLSCFPRMSLLAYRAEQLLSADQPISGHRAAGQWSQAVDACSAVVADQGKWCLRRSWGGVRSFQCPITEPGACRVAAAAGAGLDALPAPGWRQFRGCPRAR
jgi:hypothetical protein